MRYPRSVLRALTAAAITGPLAASALLALHSPATAAVYSPQQALSPAAVQQFLANPGALLTQFPAGGPELTKQIRDLAASSPTTLSALIGLLSTASPAQASAIGTGLGQVAELAVNSDPAYATEIQTAIVSANVDSAVVAFSAVVGGDIKLAAASGGGGGGGGGETPTGPSSGTGGFFGGNPQNFNTGANNAPDNFTTASFTPGSPGTPSVSPTSP